jgi:hypothetical protein
MSYLALDDVHVGGDLLLVHSEIGLTGLGRGKSSDVECPLSGN